MKLDINSLVNCVDPSSRIHTVFHTTFELVKMKYKIVLTSSILVQGQFQINIIFYLVLNEMGPGWTSQAWYFHTSVP